MIKRRFTPWIAFACMGALAACTSGDEGGPVGNTNVNVVIPNNGYQSLDPNGNPQPGLIDVRTVEYTINCLEETPPEQFLDSLTEIDDAVQINGNLEVVDGRTADQGPIPPEFGEPRPGLGAEIWQGWMDIPAPRACTLQLRARTAPSAGNPNGEVICTATEPFTTTPNAIAKVNLVLDCDVSFQHPVASLDADATFRFNVGNFCPDLFIINCLDSTPEEPVDGQGNVTGPATTICEVKFRDLDSSCGQNCDPQNCSETPAGLFCEPLCFNTADCPTEPTTVVDCGGALMDCDGQTGVTSCTFTGDQLGDLPLNGPIIGNPATFDVNCQDIVPGADVTCTAVTTDGDFDCNKTKEVTFACPGLNYCEGTPPADCPGVTACCDDPSADTSVPHPDCVTSSCNRNTQACEYPFIPSNPDETGVQCDTNPGANGGTAGRCDDGTCVDFGCTSNADCEDANACTAPIDAGTCNGSTCTGDSSIACTTDDDCNACQSDGTCLADVNLPFGTSCGFDVCDTAAGTCEGNSNVPCTADADCANAGRCDGGNCADNCTLANGVDPIVCSPNATVCESNVCVSGNGYCDLSLPQTGPPATPGTCTGDLATGCSDNAGCSGQPNEAILCEAQTDPTGTPCETNGRCDGVGTGTDACFVPLTCDPTGQGNVVSCQAIEFLAVDCELLGNSAALPIQSEVIPGDAAFAGVQLDVSFSNAIILPGALVCGFIDPGGFTSAEVANSILGLSIVNSDVPSVTTNSFLADGTAGPLLVSLHNNVFFDFYETCGNNCVDGVCAGDGETTCSVDTQGDDCAAFEETGPGILAPFTQGSPGSIPVPGTNPLQFTPQVASSTCASDNTCADGGQCATDADCLRAVSFLLNYSDLALQLRNLAGPAGIPEACIGGLCSSIPFPSGAPGTDICTSIDRGPGDGSSPEPSPRFMYDTECNKVQFDSCNPDGEQLCPNGTDAECPYSGTTPPFGFGQTCGNLVAGVCDPSPTCCLPFVEFPVVADACKGDPRIPGAGESFPDCCTTTFCNSQADFDACCLELQARWPSATPLQQPLIPVN